MDRPFFKSYPIMFDKDDAEWLGVTLGCSISISIACFFLYAIQHQNDAMNMWLVTSWLSFVFCFIWTFYSEGLAFWLFLIGSEALAIAAHSDWWMYLFGPFAVAIFAMLALMVGCICGFVLCVLYRGFIDGDNKQPITEYPMNQAKRLGWAIGNLYKLDKLMPLWMLSALTRILSIAVLVCAFGQHSYSYFMALRWIVFGSLIYTALLSLKGNIQWAVPFAALAFLFNPISIFAFSRPVWTVIDWVVAIFLVISLLDCPAAFGKEYRKLRAMAFTSE